MERARLAGRPPLTSRCCACRTDEIITEDGHELSTSQIFEYLSNVMYARRSKFDPYWNGLLVAGVDESEPYVPILCEVCAVSPADLKRGS